MAPSRKRAWLRDELILALDLYVRAGRNPATDQAESVSGILRAMPIEPDLTSDPAFRNAAAVKLKVSNFVSIDPEAPTAGMNRGGRGDQEVWNEFSGDALRRAETAKAISENVARDAVPPAAPPDELTEAPEGAILTRVHLDD